MHAPAAGVPFPDAFRHNSVKRASARSRRIPAAGWEIAEKRCLSRRNPSHFDTTKNDVNPALFALVYGMSIAAMLPE
jgi:hypothetical protein